MEVKLQHHATTTSTATEVSSECLEDDFDTDADLDDGENIDCEPSDEEDISTEDYEQLR
jgi:hypothetical protein